MTEEEKKNVTIAMGTLRSLLNEMDDTWDDTEPLYESDFNRWKEMIIEVYDILLDLREA